MRGLLKLSLTAIVVLAAAGAVALKYWDYITNPWTRDGQVRANVIQVAPRVSGPIVKLPIKDNQFVKAGDLLFEIDPRTYKAALDQASANLDQTRDHLKDLEQQVKGAQAVITLMSYPDAPLTGVVDNIGWGIAQQDGSTGADLLPSISPTFEWIRLAQRVPVRVHLTEVPAGVELRVGTTASVLVRTVTGSGSEETAAIPAPAALQ